MVSSFFLSTNLIKSSIFVPVKTINGDLYALMLCAKDENAYKEEHKLIMRNAGTQLGHAFTRSIGMETLVVSAVEGLAKLAESRDPETGDHLFRMSHYSRIIAEELMQNSEYAKEMPDSFARDILRFAPMHDIGKVGVEDRILLKNGPLTDDERAVMMLHPVIGAQVLERCEKQVNQAGYSMFGMGVEIASSHHEKFDGSGYPEKLSGKKIPLSARIVAVADVFDALTSKRPYKAAWSVEKALSVIQEDSGTHFDPVVVSAFINAQERVLDIYEKHKHI